MASWVLIPSLIKLRSEFNAVAPGRDRASDGSVGDAAHAGTSSDHNPDETGHVPIVDSDKLNEVHAIDVDDSGPWPAGFSMEVAVQYLLRECRAERELRLRYIIYNRRIWRASNGWAQETYNGPNPHTEHAHFSGSYTTALESDDSPWGVEGLVDMALETSDITRIVDAIFARDVQTPSANFGSFNGAMATLMGRTASSTNVQLPALATAVAALQASGLDEADKAQLLTAVATAQAALAAQAEENVGDVVEGVGDLLSNPALTDEQVAAALAAVLGARAVPVGVILAAG